ncbi:M64 family metallopeptidase [Tamlana crocina]|uniref:T9SS type A sorting domain-containing protein n=1 Tax=Tamlana crocina TaxID=393006 RepID=A0ABX1DC61_9FLAO|nr:M64 family metallopeptidase [Tamlana crocina]NJX14796.1 T9SS type A sorting domain-containing protein [Tamlana crocina]
MKQLLCGLICFLMGWHSFSQVFDVEPIKISGDNEYRINLVVLSEGYQTSEFTKFITDVTVFSDAMFSQSPFKEYANYFNVYAIKVPSNESGADHPATASDVDESGSTPVFVDTYFNATFDAFGYHRYLYYGIDYAAAATAEAKIRSVLADNFPSYDQALILVNTPTYGGTGGEFPIASTHANSSEIAIHELGHSMFYLKDEYLVPDVYYAEAINMTQESNPNLVKWKNWMGLNNIGIYAYGSSGTPAAWYRPHQSCKMRYLGYPFCSVCKEGMVEKVHELISPIEGYAPVSSTVEGSGFPMEFQLNLIETIPNTLETEWTLNATHFSNSLDGVAVEAADLVEGENTLTAAVHDGSTFVKVDNHESLHINTVTWTINYSTLGIEEITSTENSLSILMYPNPASDLIHFKFENSNSQTLKIDIIGMDGRAITSLSVENNGLQQLNLGKLKTGVYMARFYSDNVLLTTKKIVKN